MAVIGCDIPVRQVVGAEALSTAKAGIWTKTHFYEQGHYLHAKTYLVAAGNPVVLEFRIDLRPLEKVAGRIHQRLHAEMSKRTGTDPSIGFSFSKAWKKVKGTAKKIGKSKLIKAVGKGIKSVATSKLVGSALAVTAVVVPGVGVAALAAYGAANAAIKAVDKGKKLVSTASAVKNTLSKAGSMATKLTTAKRAAPNAALAASAAARAKAAAQTRTLAVKAKAAVALAPNAQRAAAVKAAATTQAAAIAARAKAQAATSAKKIVAQVKSAEARVVPVVKAAATLQTKLQDPAVRAKLLTIRAQADSAKKALEAVKEKAQYGTGQEKLDAQKSAAIVNLVARNEARIQAMSQQNAGGLPSLLIDAKGRIVPGRFRVVAKSGGKNPDVLYDGPKKPLQAGAFTKVAGDFDEAEISGRKSKPWTVEVYHGKAWYPQHRRRGQGYTAAEAHAASVRLQNGGYMARVTRIAGEPEAGNVEVSGRRSPFASLGWPLVKYDPKTGSALRGRVRMNPTSGHLYADTSAGYRRAVADFNAGKHYSPRVGAASSPFPPPSPSERRAKDEAYASWLAQHAPRKAPRVSGFWGIGCDCEGSQF